MIVLLDVLEHIDDDGSGLRALAALLAPRGYLMLTVPAFELRFFVASHLAIAFITLTIIKTNLSPLK